MPSSAITRTAASRRTSAAASSSTRACSRRRAPAEPLRRPPHAARASAPRFVPDRLELGDRLQVLGPPGGPLHLDQRVEVEAQAADPEERELDRVRAQLRVPATADDLAEEIDV